VPSHSEAPDAVRPAILDKLTQEAKAEILDSFVEFAATPSFGAWSKRELELKLLSLLYDSELRGGELSVGAVAQDLTVTRSRARNLVLDARTRLLAEPAERDAALVKLLSRWPKEAQVEDAGGGRLRLVIDDPFVRDLLRNHAYAAGLTLDTSFASEIVSLRWSDYATLLASVLPEDEADEVAKDVGAAIRKELAGEKEKLKEFESAMKAWEKKSPREKAERVLRTGARLIPVKTLIAALVASL
jgi:hypothetical protein